METYNDQNEDQLHDLAISILKSVRRFGISMTEVYQLLEEILSKSSLDLNDSNVIEAIKAEAFRTLTSHKGIPNTHSSVHMQWDIPRADGTLKKGKIRRRKYENGRQRRDRWIDFGNSYLQTLQERRDLYYEDLEDFDDYSEES